MNVDNILERTANAVLVAAGLCVIFFVCSRQVQSRRAIQQPPTPPLNAVEQLEGASIRQLHASLDHGGVLLFVSPSCHFCESSLPFYRRLAELARRSKLTVLLAAIDKGQPIDSSEYIAQRRLTDVQPIDAHGLATLHLQATPTVLLYNDAGRVNRAWLGELNDTSQKELESAMMELGRRP